MWLVDRLHLSGRRSMPRLTCRRNREEKLGHAVALFHWTVSGGSRYWKLLQPRTGLRIGCDLGTRCSDPCPNLFFGWLNPLIAGSVASYIRKRYLNSRFRNKTTRQNQLRENHQLPDIE